MEVGPCSNLVYCTVPEQERGHTPAPARFSAIVFITRGACREEVSRKISSLTVAKSNMMIHIMCHTLLNFFVARWCSVLWCMLSCLLSGVFRTS